MNYSDIIRLTSGVLQLAVACYALRLGRLCNTKRVGWLMFSGLSLLALTYLLLPINPFRSTILLTVKSDLIYALISVLLLVGMTHFEFRFKQRRQTENAERRVQTEWESNVEDKFGQVNQANEELQRTLTRLQAEAAEQKKRHEQSENDTQQTSQQLLLAARQAEADLRQTVNKLQSDLAEQKQAHLQAQLQAKEQAETTLQSQLGAAHQTGMAEMAGRMLQVFGSLLDNVHSAGRAAAVLHQPKTSPVSRVAKFLRSRAGDHADSRKSPLRNRPVPDGLAQLARQWNDEQSLLLRQTEVLKKRIALVQSAIQQNADELSKWIAAGTTEPAQNALPFQTPESADPAAQNNGSSEPAVENSPGPIRNVATYPEQLVNSVTQTGTESSASEPLPAADESLAAAPGRISAPARA